DLYRLVFDLDRTVALHPTVKKFARKITPWSNKMHSVTLQSNFGVVWCYAPLRGGACFVRNLKWRSFSPASKEYRMLGFGLGGIFMMSIGGGNTGRTGLLLGLCLLSSMSCSIAMAKETKLVTESTEVAAPPEYVFQAIRKQRDDKER